MINLKEVITKYPECLESASKLRSYLVDLYPEEKRSITIITTIFDCGIVEEIKKAKGEIDEIAITSYCNRLENTYAFSPKFSRECLLIWSDVYSVAEKTGKENLLAIKNNQTAIKHEKNLTKKEKLKKDVEKEATDLTFNSGIKIGDTIYFGNYPQGSNGEVKPIEWKILKIDKWGKRQRVLLISKKALDCKPFDENHGDLWKCCTLREWMNNAFYRKAFNGKEQGKIILHKYTNPTYANKSYKYKQRFLWNVKDLYLEDKVFLLDDHEVEDYLGGRSEAKCSLTKYAYEKGAYKDQKNKCFWWIICKRVYEERQWGCIDNKGQETYRLPINYRKIAVRPAIWIEI